MPDIDIEIVMPGIEAALGNPIELNTAAPPLDLTMRPEPHPPTTFNLARQLAESLPTGRRDDPLRENVRLSFAVWLRRFVKRSSRSNSEERRLRDYISHSELPKEEFIEILNEITQSGELEFVLCGDCERPTFLENTQSIDDGDRYVCERCRDNNYFECEDCNNFSSVGDAITVQNRGSICRPCYENGEYSQCDRCGNIFDNENTVYDDNTERTYCEAHAPRSQCRPKHLEFEFPALCTPQKSIKNDEIVAVTVSHGDVDQVGIRRIVELIRNRTSGKWGNYGLDTSEIQDDTILDTIWQNREGNFPKRLAKHLLIEHHLKLTDELMAEVGNVAKAHAGKPGTHYISLTRDLNQPPGEFINDGSCWWGSESNSRCTAKAMWAFGVRTWNTPGGRKDGGYPVSRAWLLALSAKEVGDGYTFKPTHALPADAYVLFNAYEIEQLPYARMIAGMVGKSYKKLPSFYANMYINSGAVLIAEQSVCDAVSMIDLGSVSRECHCGGN